MFNQKKLESGRSMIEMLGVLAIIGVLSVGGIAGYSKAMLKYKTNKAIDQLTQVSSNIRIAFTNSRDYSDLGNGTGTGGKVIDAYNIVPSEMYANKDGNGTNTYQTPWGTDVTFAVSQRTKNDKTHKRAFIIQFKNIPSSACSELALADWGGAPGGGLIAMSVTNSSGKPATNVNKLYEDACTGSTADNKGIYCVANPSQNGTAMTGQNSFPVSPGSAVIACGTTGFSNMAWKFY